MKVKLPKKQIVIFFIILIICTIAIAEAVYLVMFSEPARENEVGSTTTESNEELEQLKENFDSIFNNELVKTETTSEIEKKEDGKEYIYTGYEKIEKSAGKYDLDVSIPIFNIQSADIEKCNNQIKQIFQDKAEAILTNQDNISNTVYSVKYQAYYNENLISIVIKSTLKEGENAQRVILQTYTYDTVEKRFVEIDDLVKKKQLNQATIENKIKEEIQSANAQAKALQELGYNVYSRDLRSDIYEYENINNYFIDDQNHLYVIYAYGNKYNTSEMDLVIF